MVVFVIHLILGVLLFFIINWIGRHSYSIGYVEISIFAKNEEAPALNFLIRVLAPVVYIIILSAILYYFKLDYLVNRIYLVSIYYVGFRLLFSILTNRSKLINWYRQIAYWIGIITLSYLAYINIIRDKRNILPDFTTIANELWIIILLFLFQVANNVNTSNSLSNRRKQNYIRSRYLKFRSKYGNIIKNIVGNEKVEAIVYAIMIYEDFNRPKAIRIIENIKQRMTGKPHTIGLMQVRSDKILTDEQSVILGTNKLMEAYTKYVRENENDEEGSYDVWAFSQIISDYNGGSSYNQEVVELANIILAEFYPNTNDELMPKPTVQPE